MKELLDDIDRWRAAGKRVAVARVVDIEGSGPRDPGAAMAVNEDGEVAGSVSGGCVEGAVVSEALGDPARRRRAPASSRSATATTRRSPSASRAAAPSTCSSNRSTGDQPIASTNCSATAPRRAARRARHRHRRPAAWAASCSSRPTTRREGSLGDPELDRIVARDALGRARGRPQRRPPLRPAGRDHARGPASTRPSCSVFIESWAPPPQMWIFGAVDFTAALGKVAKVLGYRVTVCDAREVFATRRRFPMADEVVVSLARPAVRASAAHTLGQRDAVCILTHDPKFDVPAVQGALATSVGYIGVMGSRKTHAKRHRAAAPRSGVDRPEQLDRLMSPIGLDLGARTPEETAISICAEIIARRTGRAAPSLRDGDGPIHS